MCLQTFDWYCRLCTTVTLGEQDKQHRDPLMIKTKLNKKNWFTQFDGANMTPRMFLNDAHNHNMLSKKKHLDWLAVCGHFPWRLMLQTPAIWIYEFACASWCLPYLHLNNWDALKGQTLTYLPTKIITAPNAEHALLCALHLISVYPDVYNVIWCWKKTLNRSESNRILQPGTPAELLHVSVGSHHDLEHRQQVLSVAAHGSSAEVLLLSARARRVMVVTWHNPCRNTVTVQCGILSL